MDTKDLKHGDSFKYRNNIFEWRDATVVGLKKNGQIEAEKPTGGLLTIPNSPAWELAKCDDIDIEFEKLSNEVSNIACKFNEKNKCSIVIEIKIEGKHTPLMRQIAWR